MSDADGLDADEVVPVGGVWGGMLFTNPHIGLPLSFYWSFHFDCVEVARSYGTSPVGLTVDWLSAPRRSWREMSGFQIERHEFGEGFEASVYFFEHYRYDAVRLSVRDQRGSDVLVSAEISGDVDGLGLDALRAESWLTFSGLLVPESAASESVADTERVLAEFTAVDGLVATQRGTSVVLAPRG